MTAGTWMLFPFATSIFFAAVLRSQSYSYEDQKQFPNELFCRPVCKNEDLPQGDTFHCVLSNEEKEYKFLARNPKEKKWHFYRTDLDFDSSSLCQIGEYGDRFIISKSKRKCFRVPKFRDSNDNIGHEFISNIMKRIVASQKSEESDNSIPLSRKSNLAVSASGPGSYAQASDGIESLFVNGDKGPFAQTFGNGHAFSSDGKTNAESHFGNDFTYPATGYPTGGKPNGQSMPPFISPFQQRRPPYFVFESDLPAKKPGTDYSQQSFGLNSRPFDGVFGSVGLANPFLMLRGQPATYSGSRNLRPGLFQPSSVNPLFPMNVPSDYAVAFVPYMNPYMPPYEAPQGHYPRCYPRCKRAAIDSASDENTSHLDAEDAKSEENISQLGTEDVKSDEDTSQPGTEDVKSDENPSDLDTQLSEEICNIIETEVCRHKRIIYCKDEACCWEKVRFDTCKDGQSDLSTDCNTRLSTILGLN